MTEKDFLKAVTADVRKGIGVKNAYWILGVGGFLSQHAIAATAIGAALTLFLVPSLTHAEARGIFGMFSNLLILLSLALLVMPLILKMKLLKPDYVQTAKRIAEEHFPVHVKTGIFGVKAVLDFGRFSADAIPDNMPRTRTAYLMPQTPSSEVARSNSDQASQNGDPSQPPPVPPVPPQS